MAGEMYTYNAAGDLVLVDPASYTANPYGSTAAKYSTGYNPVLASPSDIKRQRDAAWGTLGAQTGIGAALTAAQIGLAMAPTALDKSAATDLARLEGLSKAGKMGLDAGQRQQAEATIMNPARALATEATDRGEAFAASMSGGDVKALERERVATKKVASDAAVKGGIAIEQMDLEAEANQRREMAELRAYKDRRDVAPLEMVGQALQQTAPLWGKAAAGFAESRAPYDSELLAYAKDKPGFEGQDADALRTFWKQGKLTSAAHADTAAKQAAKVLQTGSLNPDTSQAEGPAPTEAQKSKPLLLPPETAGKRDPYNANDATDYELLTFARSNELLSGLTPANLRTLAEKGQLGDPPLAVVQAMRAANYKVAPPTAPGM